ncbi:transcriptional regulator, HxlR family [Streptomyces sp. LamerLS-316]|uniref:winged helix-turn-helix transcriptional regulator n=1 Tax=unclassified Streptomyces TaxID=2593676 RepID=UPI000823EC15|nr:MULTISPECIES: helix-turn-helix domain-containing protein [unclassified Streptomyces]MYQ37410.1 transcriptional regulator [Streptomyces sp. SID4921]SCK44408.1 transcriptional regulator, HxlR family [Streptomyces sp. LamerLS-316]
MVEGVQPRQAEAGKRYDVFHTDCVARDVVDHVTSRWGIWVLISLRSQDLRFYELRESIQGVSEKMLAQTLRALVQDGLVRREVEPTTPPQVTYGLTEFGRDVGEPLTELFDRITRRLSPSGTDGVVAAGARPRHDG